MKHCWDMEDGKGSLLARQGGLHSGACCSVATGMMGGVVPDGQAEGTAPPRSRSWGEGGHHLKDLSVWILQR